MIETTFEKRNGQIIRRIRNTYPSYRIGDETSMGWKVVDIRYKYKNKYYHKGEYDNKIDTCVNRIKKLCKFKKNVQSIYRQVVYATELLIIIKFFNVFATNLHF